MSITASINLKLLSIYSLKCTNLSDYAVLQIYLLKCAYVGGIRTVHF